MSAFLNYGKELHEMMESSISNKKADREMTYFIGDDGDRWVERIIWEGRCFPTVDLIQIEPLILAKDCKGEWSTKLMTIAEMNKMKEKEMEFKVGDKVKIEGTLVRNLHPGYPLALEIGRHVVESFTKDGRSSLSMPVILSLVERPKKKIKKTFWMLYHPDQEKSFVYHSELAARNSMNTQHKVELIEFEREVEVDG